MVLEPQCLFSSSTIHSIFPSTSGCILAGFRGMMHTLIPEKLQPLVLIANQWRSLHLPPYCEYWIYLWILNEAVSREPKRTPRYEIHAFLPPLNNEVLFLCIPGDELQLTLPKQWSLSCLFPSPDPAPGSSTSDQHLRHTDAEKALQFVWNIILFLP